MSDAQPVHKSVLLDELLGYLEIDDRSIVIDATRGLGGHSEAILERFRETQVVGIDQDTMALDLAAKQLSKFGSRFRGFHSNFVDVKQVAIEAKIDVADAIIADLGVSSLQLDDISRGFSFRSNAAL